jgi:hypothetical protein
MFMRPTVLHFAATLACFGLASSSVFAQSETAVVVVAAPVRIMPDASRAPLTTLKAGATLRVEEHQGDWYRVSFRDPQWGPRAGYVLAEHVTITNSPGVGPAIPPAKAEPSRPVEVPITEVGAEPKPAPATAPVRVSERPAAASRYGGISKRAISESIAIGRRQSGREQGLHLADSGQQFAATLGGLDRPGTPQSNEFSLQVYTPLAWIRQLAGNARQEHRTFRLDDVSDDATEAVLRIIVYPHTRNTVAKSGMSAAASVRHVVLCDRDGRVVVQPTFKEPFQEVDASAMRGRATLGGVLVKFPMDTVREVRGPAGDRDFFITVTGSTGVEKNFRVEKKHFDGLPGSR